MLIGGTVLLAIFGIWQALTDNGSPSRAWLLVVFLAIYLVGFFCLQAATRPIRGRTDQRQSWKERFPAHREQELDRFLQIVGEELGLRKERWRRLRPDDRMVAVTQQWLCGDGMDIIELFLAIEQEYELDLPESFHTPDRTLGDLFAYVTQHSSRGGGSSQPEMPTQPEGG